MDGLADHIVVQCSTGLVVVEIHRPVLGDANGGGGADGVDVGAQEKEFPAVFFLLPPDHGPDPVGGVFPAGVLHAVGGDDEEGLFGPVLLPGVLVDIADVMDGAAHGIQQGGAAPDPVVLPGHGADLLQGHPVVDHIPFGIKQDGGDIGLAGHGLLLFDHGVEAADGVRFQTRHGAAAVEDEYDLGQILFHNKNLL